MGGRGKRRRNIGQNHGGAKDCGGVKKGWYADTGYLGRVGMRILHKYADT